MKYSPSDLLRQRFEVSILKDFFQFDIFVLILSLAETKEIVSDILIEKQNEKKNNPLF